MHGPNGRINLGIPPVSQARPVGGAPVPMQRFEVTVKDPTLSQCPVWQVEACSIKHAALIILAQILGEPINATELVIRKKEGSLITPA